MNALVSFLLMALQQLLPLITANAGATSGIVQTLVNITPLVIQEAQDLLPMVQAIIKALSSSTGVSDSDMATLKILDAQCDDAFDAAVAAKDAEGNANG